MKALTDKEAYEIVRDNTSWTWVFPEDVKYRHGWIFHRTRDCDTMSYHRGRKLLIAMHKKVFIHLNIMGVLLNLGQIVI